MARAAGERIPNLLDAGARMDVEFFQGPATSSGDTSGAPGPRESAYDVANTDFLADLNRYIPDAGRRFRALDPRRIGSGDAVAERLQLDRARRRPAAGLHGPYGATARPTALHGAEQDAFCDGWVRQGGGNLVLTDGALRALPEVTGVPALRGRAAQAVRRADRVRGARATSRRSTSRWSTAPNTSRQEGARFNSGNRPPDCTSRRRWASRSSTPRPTRTATSATTPPSRPRGTSPRPRSEGAGGRVAGQRRRGRRRRAATPSTTAPRWARSRAATGRCASSARCSRSPARRSTTTSGSSPTRSPTPAGCCSATCSAPTARRARPPAPGPAPSRTEPTRPGRRGPARRRAAARPRRAAGTDGGGRPRARRPRASPRGGAAARRGLRFLRPPERAARHVDVFQTSPRPRASSASAWWRASATARAASRGTAGRTGEGRTVTDGYYFVRFRTRIAQRAQARHPPRGAAARRTGASRGGPSFYRRASCGTLNVVQARAAGVRRARQPAPLYAAYRLPRRATCGCEVLRGGDVRAHRSRARGAAGARDRTALRFDAERRARRRLPCSGSP